MCTSGEKGEGHQSDRKGYRGVIGTSRDGGCDEYDRESE